MEWVWIIGVAACVGTAARWWRARQVAHRRTSAELEAVRRIADEDVTHLGQLVQQLGVDVERAAAADEVRVAHQAALDSSVTARHLWGQVTDAAGISEVTATVATGHHAVACAGALLSGEPVPERRAVCFFDPQHGRSVSDILWNRGGHGPRRVPACQHDAALVADTQQPRIRTVQLGTRTMPYWAAGSAFLAYTKGYFSDVPTLAWALTEAAVESAPDRPGYFGTGIVGSSGHFDGGGFDGSGAGT
ncbi:conserved hypothetical protein [metagenome]|uniref:Uncharacterized protein n=1 Tax=metagenome TaxID=256318 RepID=A0A2P2BXT8_9ZZZZ